MLDTDLNQLSEESIYDNSILKVSIIGRPNAGKSTLVNAFLGEDRLVVSSTSGTTRDSIDVPIQYADNQFILIDTAGCAENDL